MLRRRPGGLPYPKVTLGAPPSSAPPSPAPWYFQPSYRPPEVEGEYARANHQLYFLIARGPAAVKPDLFRLLSATGRLPEIEPDYSRANHQAFFQFIPPPVFAGPPQPSTVALPIEIDAGYPLTNHNLFFLIARQPQAGTRPYPIAATYRPPEIEWGYNPRTEHQLYFQIARQPPSVIPPAAPIAGGGLLPGRPPGPPEELGRGMGPYKRPGQVFGEPDPLSPYLTSRAPEIPAGIPLPVASAWLIVEPTPLQQALLEPNEDELIAFLVLYMECARDKR